MKKKRLLVRLVLLGVLGLILVGATVGVIFYKVGQVGSTGVEQWAGRWLKARIEENVNLRLHFSSLDYQYPFTLMLHGLRVEADDSRSPGQSIDLIVAEQAELTLAETPEAGQPLLIERMIIRGPEVRLIEDPDGPGYVGFNTLTAAEATGATAGQPVLPPDETNPLGDDPDAELADAEPVTKPESQALIDAGDPALGDVSSARTLPIQLRRLELIDGFVEYQSAAPDAEPMLINGIQVASDLLPEGNDRYRYEIGIARAPELVVEHEGTIDVQQLEIDVQRLSAQLNLDGAGDESLPMAIRRFLQTKRVRGDYRFEVTGRVPLSDFYDSTLDLTAEFDDCYLRHAGWTYPVQSLRWTGRFADRAVEFAPLRLEALDGTVQVDGRIALDDYYTADLTLDVDGVELGLFDDVGDATRQQYLGKLDTDIEWQGSLLYYHVDANGGGSLRFYEARLADIPFLTEFGDLIDPKRDEGRRGRDEVTAEFDFRRTNAFIDRFTATSGAIGAMGQGRIHFDQRMNLLFRAGPLERLQALLGGSGGDRFSSLLSQYRAYGTFTDYSVRIVDSGARLDE